MKTQGLTLSLLSIRADLRNVGENGIPGGAVECADIRRNTSGKAVLWTFPDAEKRKRGEQTGLDTLVVHAVNGGH